MSEKTVEEKEATLRFLAEDPDSWSSPINRVVSHFARIMMDRYDIKNAGDDFTIDDLYKSVEQMYDLLKDYP